MRIAFEALAEPRKKREMPHTNVLVSNIASSSRSDFKIASMVRRLQAGSTWHTISVFPVA